MTKSLKKSNNSKKSNMLSSDSSMSQMLYNIGAACDVGAVLVLVYHAIMSLYHHTSIHIALLLFTIGKALSKVIQLPYQWDKYSVRVKCLTNICIYSTITALYLYGIVVMKL